MRELSRVQMNVPYGTPLTAPASPPEGYADEKQLIRKAATSTLTFMTFS